MVSVSRNKEPSEFNNLLKKIIDKAFCDSEF